MARGSEEELGRLHGLVAQTLLEALQSEHQVIRLRAVQDAMRFLKDNNITATKNASPAMANIANMLPDRDALERMMNATPGG